MQYFFDEGVVQEGFFSPFGGKDFIVCVHTYRANFALIQPMFTHYPQAEFIF